MAKKTSKITRGDQYKTIMEKQGIQDYSVLSFAFTYQLELELFHFMLMAERLAYYLFDCWERYANIIVPNDEQNAAKIVEIAEKNGGEKINQNVR